MDLEIKEGDWVTSFSSGLWQIYRVLSYKGINPVSKSEKLKTSVFSKRFVLNSLKPSFKEECCSPDFVERLDPETNTKLEEYIRDNETLHKEFNEYKPKPIDSIYNARIGVPEGKSLEATDALICKDRNLNELEIGPYLKELGFDITRLPSWTVQFISEDHNCQDGYLIYRFARILDF